MKLTIIGDSNGCGEFNIRDEYHNHSYYRKLISGNDMVFETNFGIDTFLDEIGHVCFNTALFNNTNIRTLIDLEYSLLLRLPRHKARFLTPDYIIWFLTEPLRELRILNSNVYDNDNKYTNDVNEIIRTSDKLFDMNIKLLDYSFQIAENIYQITKIPFIIVEGLSETFDLEKKYNFSKFVIKNWIGDIAGVTPPIVSCYQTIDISHNFLSEKNEIFDIIDNCEKWNELMRHHSDFPDHFHPSREKHKELAIKINSIINE